MPRFQYLEFRDGDNKELLLPRDERTAKERTTIAAALAGSPTGFRLDLHSRETGGGAVVWMRMGSAAGSLVWLCDDMPVAQAVFLGGRNDEEDKAALRSVENAQDLSHHRRAFVDVRITNRPLAAVFFQNEQAARSLPIAEQSLCMAETFFAAVGATEDAPPLGEAEPTSAKYFYRFDVNRKGAHGSCRITFNQLREVPDLLPTIDTFVSRLLDSPEGFEQWLQFRQFPKFIFRWKAFGPTVGFAAMQVGENSYEESMMFLSGVDAVAESGAIDRFKGSTPPTNQEEYQRSFDAIRSGPRPLLVTIGDKGAGEVDPSIDLVQWSFAGAYFRMRGVA